MNSRYPDPNNPALKFPEQLPGHELLVGWSLEHRHPVRPIGFSFGDPFKTPATGYLDPILFEDEGHLMTIAPTGAGKGTGCIVPALLRHDGPVIVVDPKGENVAITARQRQTLGQQVHVLDPMGVCDGVSGALNPLDFIDIHSPASVDDAATIAHCLWAGPMQGNDRFWIGRAQQLLTGLMLHLLADCSPEMQNLPALRELIARAVESPELIVATLKNSSHPEARLSASSLGIAAPETLGGILAFAQEMTDFLRGPLVQATMQNSSFDIAQITSGNPISLYIVIPPHMLDSHGRLLRLWVSVLLMAITRRRGRPEKPTLFILDEAAQLGDLPQLRQAITLLRGYGLQTWSFWQDVSQLQTLYPTAWRTMVNNCRVLQCFGALNMRAAGDMAELTGFGNAETIIDLAHNEMVLQLAGDEAVVARLPDYRTDAPFAGQFGINPYHDKTRDISPRVHAPIRFYERSTRSVLPQGSTLGAVPASASDADPLHQSLSAMWPDAT